MSKKMKVIAEHRPEKLFKKKKKEVSTAAYIAKRRKEKYGVK